MPTMSTGGFKTAAWVILAVVAGVVGYAAGQRQSHRAAIQMMQAQAAGNLTQRIEALSFLRTGDMAEAIHRLESEADLLTSTIAGNNDADQHALAYMKTYLSVVPPSPDRDTALSAALAGVQILAPGECNSGLKALILSAPKSN